MKDIQSPKLVSHKYCTGCMACYDACGHNAIEVKYQVDIPFPYINKKKCVECHKCEKVCPILNPITRNDIINIKAYGGWCKKEQVRINGASGGAFGAFAFNMFSLYEKVAIVGASLVENRVYMTLVDDVDQLDKLQNSKYIQSDSIGIYRKTKSYLEKDYVVLFSGTPCLVAGLYGFLRNNNYDKLYTIDLICHGVASREALDLHLKYFNSSMCYSFRDKIEGQEIRRTVIEKDHQQYRVKTKEDIFYPIFSAWLTDRKSCSNCHYSKLPRIADVTIADYWGGQCDKKEYKKGVSLILTNNEKGQNLVSQTENLYIFSTDIKNALRGNPNSYAGYKFVQYHPLVIWPAFFKRVLPSQMRLAILTNQMPWWFLLAPYKVLTKLYVKLYWRWLKRKLK